MTTPPPVTLDRQPGPPTRVGAAGPDRPGPFDALLRWGDRRVRQLQRLLTTGLPRDLDPLAYTGALSAWTFIIATVTGVLLLLWYDTSVHTAHDSILKMRQSPYTAELVRTLHKLSSDACMLFALIHLVKVVLARSFGGPRWIAWVTGLIALWLIWLDGWLGYWLVWDARGQAVAVGSARLLDVLPLFPEPFARSFLTDADINSLMFFAVFFFHMLIPMAIGVVLWIHLVRLKAPSFMPPKRLLYLSLAVLVVLSLAFPASLAAPARMAVYTEGFSIDWFYLLPLLLIERVGGGTVWIFTSSVMLVLLLVPWLFGPRRRTPAFTAAERCTGCSQCSQDCPYHAITMIPAEGRYDQVSIVDPDKCTSCGVCIGACDPAALEYADLDVRSTRREIGAWLEADAEAAPEDRCVAFVCADSAGHALRVDPLTGRSDALPGYHVVGIPCAAWLHPATVDAVVRRGGRALLVGCGSEPRCRQGAEIAGQRMAGTREPELRTSHVEGGAFAYLQLDASQSGRLSAAAAAFRAGRPVTSAARRKPAVLLAGGALLVLLSALTVLFGDFGYYAPPARPAAQLVITFKHAGAAVEEASNVDSKLPHLKGMKTRSRLLPVRMRVRIDGKQVLQRSFPPRGLRKNSASIGIVTLPVSAGWHKIEVDLGDTADENAWPRRFEQSLEFGAKRRRIVKFSADAGFTWN